MITIIKTLNLNRQTTAILENAYAISYEKQVNEIWSASFSLPINDPKVSKVELLKYVEIPEDDGTKQLYRIIPKRTSSTNHSVTFECEHVLATLLGVSLFKYHQLSNYTTRDVLEYLLSQQHHKHWQLGRCAFTRYFHYSWENENLLSAIYSVPRPFDQAYQFNFDTSSYPWTLHLDEPETLPTCRIKEGYNLEGFELEEDPRAVYNRIYPLGAGEGVNQLGIESVNNGIPYIEDVGPDEEIIETVWSDKRFENADILKASAEVLLKKWKNPIVTWVATARDVSKITGLNIDKLKYGKVIRLDLDDYPTVDLRIAKESRSDITGDPGNVTLDIGNVQEDLSTTNADMQRRQQINELYSQGATNVLNFSYQDNCDSNIPALIPFYIDDDVVNVNTMELTFRTKAFRTYSRATLGGGALVDTTKAGGAIVKATGGGGAINKTTSSGGATVQSTSSGGGTTATSSSGGGTSKSTNSGGGTTNTSGAGGGIQGGETAGIVQDGGGLPPYETHTHLFFLDNHTHSVSFPAHSHSFSTPNHTHNVEVPNHTHGVTVPNHVHEFELPNHTHEIQLPDHVHEIELPNHEHAVKHEIIELDTTPNSVTIKVDGNTVPHTSTTADRLNLVDYMSRDNNGKITRGRHEVEILPDGLARIEADLIGRVFIQSQLGGVF